MVPSLLERKERSGEPWVERKAVKYTHKAEAAVRATETTENTEYNIATRKIVSLYP
jgi:hypothetical protein